MAKVVDPDVLAQGIEVEFNVSTKKISLSGFSLNPSSDISDSGTSANNGITFQCLYSFAKEEWRTDANLIKFPFPFVSITGEQFELVNGWDFVNQYSRNLIRDGGWALKNNSGVSQEEFMNLTTLGTFNNSALDNVYYLQSASTSGTPITAVFSGEANQAVKIYGDASHGDLNYNSVFKLYLREQGKTYGFYDLMSSQNLSSLTYKKYALPISNAVDLKIGVADSGIDSNGDGVADVHPYSGMSITYFQSGQTRFIGGNPYNFKIIINGASSTAEQIYAFVQWSLRQSTDIDSSSTGNTRGDIAEELLAFVGDTLKTKLTSRGGVYIDNFLVADTNRLVFVDDTGAERTYPFVAAGVLQFNDNLQNDANAVYRLFFTNDDSGDNLGRDFGTASAMTIQNNSDIDITGNVGGVPSIPFDYDYDFNNQRGNSSVGTDVPYTAVAIGLGTAQYVVTTGTLIRSVANVINFVSSLERNYLNP